MKENSSSDVELSKSCANFNYSGHYLQNLDRHWDLYQKLYPRATKIFKDIYGYSDNIMAFILTSAKDEIIIKLSETLNIIKEVITEPETAYREGASLSEQSKSIIRCLVQMRLVSLNKMYTWKKSKNTRFIQGMYKKNRRK